VKNRKTKTSGDLAQTTKKGNNKNRSSEESKPKERRSRWPWGRASVQKRTRILIGGPRRCQDGKSWSGGRKNEAGFWLVDGQNLYDRHVVPGKKAGTRGLQVRRGTTIKYVQISAATEKGAPESCDAADEIQRISQRTRDALNAMKLLPAGPLRQVNKKGTKQRECRWGLAVRVRGGQNGRRYLFKNRECAGRAGGRPCQILGADGGRDSLDPGSNIRHAGRGPLLGSEKKGLLTLLNGCRRRCVLGQRSLLGKRTGALDNRKSWGRTQQDFGKGKKKNQRLLFAGREGRIG